MLVVCFNQIGDVGIAAFATAITPVTKGGSGALPNLTQFFLDFNNIGDAGMAALSTALVSGALPHLQVRPSHSIHSPFTPPSRHVHA